MPTCSVNLLAFCQLQAFTVLLDLPLFEEGHRDLARRLAVFAGEQIEPLAGPADAGDTCAFGREFSRRLAEEGLFRFLVPRQYGGLAESPDLRSICLVREALAARSALADTVFAVDGLGSYPIGLTGSESVKTKYLPRVANGSALSAFALTEKSAGSDVSAIETAARRDGDDYVLNGTKTLISNAGIADFFVVFASSGRQGERNVLTAFVVDADTRGLRISQNIPLIAPHPIGELIFEDCRVSSTCRLGGEGDGFRLALATLDFFRGTVAAAACGLASRALSESLSYARRRRQFGTLLSDFQATRFALADMATELDAARLLVYRAAWTKDQGASPITREASSAKLFATEAAQRIVDRAVQIHGGLGVVRGVVVERLYREVRALRIYEGTSEIQRLVIADQILKASESQETSN